jgi:hypothetical protein
MTVCVLFDESLAIISDAMSHKKVERNVHLDFGGESKTKLRTRFDHIAEYLPQLGPIGLYSHVISNCRFENKFGHLILSSENRGVFPLMIMSSFATFCKEMLVYTFLPSFINPDTATMS